MGLLNKVMFWKKDELDFDKLAKEAMGKESLGHDDPFSSGSSGSSFDHKNPFDTQGSFPPNQAAPFATVANSAPGQAFSAPEEQRRFSSPQMAQQPTGRDREMELLNSKLDTIKALLNSIDGRLGQLEKNTNSSATGKQAPGRLW